MRPQRVMRPAAARLIKSVTTCSSRCRTLCRYSERGKSPLCVCQCRSPQWRRRGSGSGSVPGRTLWRGGGCFAERGKKARVAGGRGSGGRPGHAETRSAGDPGLAGWDAGRSARLGRPAAPGQRHQDASNRARGTDGPCASGYDSDGASVTAARLQPWGTDLGLTACVPRGTDSDGAHLPPCAC
jgi:hypothetical protein